MKKNADLISEIDLSKDYSKLQEEVEKILSKSSEKDIVKETDENKLPAPIDEKIKKWGMYDKILELCVKDSDSNRKLKNKYGWALIGALIAQLVFVDVMLILKGNGILKFSESVFNIFISGTFVEIISLVVIIVKYLFKDNLGDALKIILCNNDSKNEEQK